MGEEPHLEATHAQTCVVSQKYRLPYVQEERQWRAMVCRLQLRSATMAVSIAKWSVGRKAHVVMELSHLCSYKHRLVLIEANS